MVAVQRPEGGESMQAVGIPQITERLQELPPDKLAVVYDFVSYLLDRETKRLKERPTQAYQTMVASESILRRDWDRPEEDIAWAEL
jgi:hypothetical protein